MRSIARLLIKFSNEGYHERFGQWFINHYIKSYISGDKWIDELWEAKIERAKEMVEEWLVNNQYEHNLPPRIN